MQAPYTAVSGSNCGEHGLNLKPNPMHDAEGPNPSISPKLPTWQVFTESWEICRCHFIALTGPTILMGLILVLISAIAEKTTSMPIGAFLTLPLGVMAAMSVHRAVMDLKLDGTRPTFQAVIQAGAALFGRGIASSLLTLTASVLVYFAGVLLIFPGTLIWVQTKSPAAGLLLWAGIIGAFYLYQWFLTRICLVPSAAADRELGLFEALKYAWKASSHNFKRVRLVWLGLLAFIAITSLTFTATYWFLVGFEFCNGSSAFMMLLFPVCIAASFVFSLINTALCLTYLSSKATRWSPMAPPMPPLTKGP